MAAEWGRVSRIPVGGRGGSWRVNRERVQGATSNRHNMMQDVACIMQSEIFSIPQSIII